MTDPGDTELAPASSGLLPNIEALLTRFLRLDADVSTLCADRVYTTLPAGLGTWPTVRVTRIGGAPLFDWPVVLDNPVVQIDAWGDSKAQTWRLVETIRAALVARLPGRHPHGLVYGGPSLRLGALRYLPDTVFDPARPRYVVDATFLTRL